MTHEQLLAFLAVARHGTFSAASAALHKSQPAVSKLVRNLEDDLGLLLLDRAAYRPVLTDAGRQFHERARALVESTEALRGFGLALGGHVEPVLRLVVEAVTPLSCVTPVLRAIQQRFSSVRIELRTERMSGAIEALKDSSADVVIASTRGMDTRVMEERSFVAVRLAAVVHCDHPLAHAGAPVPTRLLRQHAQVVLRDSSRSEPSVDINVLAGGLRWSVTDIASKLEIIQAGMGWGGLPEHVVAPALARGTLVRLEVREFDVPQIDLFTLRRRDRAAGPVAQALWSGLAARAEQERARVAEQAPRKSPKRARAVAAQATRKRSRS